MKNLTKLATVAMVGLIILLVAGCGTSDKYDGLKVVDGNGRVLVLRHNIGDNYFIDLDEPEQPTPNSEINKKLKITTGN